MSQPSEECIEGAIRHMHERAFRRLFHRYQGTEQPKRCPLCGRYGKDIFKRRKNTEYNDEESNWVTGCGECYQAMEDYYTELWAEYYASVL